MLRIDRGSMFILCMLCYYACFLVSADLFYKPPFVNLFSRNTIRVSNRLDRDQARRFVGPDLGLNCL